MAGPNATAITTPGAAQIVASAGAFADTVPSTVVGVLAVATTSVPAGIENVDYGTQTLTATGGVGAYTWSHASGSGPLPTGLSLAANGEITGIPTTSGTYDFTIEVTSDGSV